MPVYYRGPGLLITHREFAVRGPQPRVFAVAGLHDLYVVRGDPDPSRGYSAHAAGGALVVAVASWPLLRSPAAYLIVLFAVGIPAVVSGMRCRLRPRLFELRGSYAEQEVRLYASTDALAFGQVVRALVRALEANQYDREIRGAAGFH